MKQMKAMKWPMVRMTRLLGGGEFDGQRARFDGVFGGEQCQSRRRKNPEKNCETIQKDGSIKIVAWSEVAINPIPLGVSVAQSGFLGVRKHPVCQSPRADLGSEEAPYESRKKIQCLHWLLD
jgi:hypothetical protein